jgi:putative transcriptional regulator
MKDYPNAIRKLRAKLNISQQELADMLGVSFPSVNRWENGHYEPTIIAKVRLDELFKENNIELCEVTNNENN